MPRDRLAMANLLIASATTASSDTVKLTYTAQARAVLVSLKTDVDRAWIALDGIEAEIARPKV